MDKLLEILKDEKLDYRQRRHALAAYAENQLPYVDVKKESMDMLKKGIICDLFEGNAPYRPRYILPDYKKFMKEGCKFLEIDPPKDMYEAINALLIIYSYVPSITSYPVFLGNIDELLEEFVNTVTHEELIKLLRMFLINIDRTLPDAFVHMDLGPKDSVIGREVLKLEKELKKAIPNISLRVDENTPEDYKLLAVETALEVGKPYFINHPELSKVKGENYGIASCYNSLLIGGGSYTLVRCNLKALSETSKDYKDFLENSLPKAMAGVCDIVNARAKFIVEEIKFFENSFLAKEGFISLENFTSMAAIFGLYEAVQNLSGGQKMGIDEKADDMAEEIVKTAYETVKSFEGAYCKDGKIGFHAQSGIDSDVDVTAGVRIRIGEEPPIYNQIRVEGRLQKYFDTGVSDIYIFDKTAKKNYAGVLKIIKGAFKNGIRIMAINTNDSDLIRITGYLVKRSDVKKYNEGAVPREGTVVFGADSIKNNRILDRKVNSIE